MEEKTPEAPDHGQERRNARQAAGLLVGCWRLVSFELRTAAGNLLLPYGETPNGRIIYLRSGIMSAHLGAAERNSVLTGEDGLPERALDAIRTHFSYSGRYRVADDKVLHDVELCIVPDWVGRTVVRGLAFDDQDLILTDYAVKLAQYEGVGTLRWRRET